MKSWISPHLSGCSLHVSIDFGSVDARVDTMGVFLGYRQTLLMIAVLLQRDPTAFSFPPCFGKVEAESGERCFNVNSPSSRLCTLRNYYVPKQRIGLS